MGAHMTNNTQSRKWLITINNPEAKGYTHEVIENTLSKMKSIVYWCMSDETGEEGTYHTHIYICSASGVRFSTLLKKFDGGHFDMARGTSQQNRDYVFKEGKWAKTEKETTNHKETHKEWGTMPVERQGKRNDLDDLYDMICSGMSNYQIIEDNPTYMLQLDKIERVRQTVKEAQFAKVWRDIEVTYIFGNTGAGKTRSVMEKYGYENVYRITDYQHPFDSYKQQDVIIFEEFRSSLKVEDMLKYLDGYPVELPARYMNRVACFTKVYIITNIDIREQYPNIQEYQKETWYAFLRRIQNIHVFCSEYQYVVPTELYINDFFPFIEYCPFIGGSTNE